MSSETRNDPAGGRTVVCTIVSKNYLAYARTLMDSLRKLHDDLSLVTLLVDTIDGKFDPAREPYQTLLASELPIPKWSHFSMKYEIMELNTAVKPYLLEALFERFGAEKVVYLDPDIVVYQRLDALFDRLERDDVVLTPHILEPIDDGRSPSELDFLRVGTYNLGFFAAARRGRWKELLRWWQKKVYRDCTTDVDRGVFVDQHWIDLVPGMFDRVGVLRDPCYNVAYWNFKHRDLKLRSGTYEINGSPLVFMHFSGFSVENMERVSKHQNRYVLSDLNEHYRALFDDYRDRLLANGHETTSRWSYAYGSFEDGAPISYPLRVCLRKNDPDGDRWPDPFDVRGAGNFRSWATTPAAGERWRFLTPYALTLHGLHQDLQARYPLLEVAKDVARWFERDFARWMVQQRGTTNVFHPIYVDPVREAMETAKENDPTPTAVAPARDGGSGRASPWARVSSTIRYYRAYPRDIAPFVHPFAIDVSPEIYTGPGGLYGWIRRKFIGLGVLRRIKRLVGMRFILSARYFFSFPHSGDLPLPDGFPEYAPPRLSWARSAAAGRKPLRGKSSGGNSVAGAAKRGVNVIGYTRSESGVGQISRSLLRCLSDADFPVAKLTVQAHDISRKEDRDVENVANGVPYPINVFNVNADSTAPVNALLGPAVYENRYNVAYWFWELSRFPERWIGSFDPYDEIWVSSAFAHAAVSEWSPVPVVKMPIAIEVSLPDGPMGRERAFDLVKINPAGATLPTTRIVLPPKAFLVLYVFDALSIIERKNPWGAVRAFERAFGGKEGAEDARLVIKVSNLDQAPEEEVMRLREEMARVKGVLMDGYLDRIQVNALIHECDVYLSLHRSEGFGLTIAEAMYLGKPSVATAYSGNMDFMTPSNSFLVPYEEVTVARDYPPYDQGCLWAEPDWEAAAGYLRLLYDEPEEGRRRARVAAGDIRRHYAPKAVAAKVVRRLELIRRRLAACETGGDGSEEPAR